MKYYPYNGLFKMSIWNLTRFSQKFGVVALFE